MTHDEILTKNMELAGVIRALRANAREDAARIERLERERDEARDALMKIEDRCVDGEDACDDIVKIRDIAVKALEGAK